MVELEKLNNPLVDALVEKAFSQNNFGNKEKAEIGKLKIFEEMWNGLEIPKSKGPQLDEKIFEMISTGRVILIGLNEEFKEANFIMTLRKSGAENKIDEFEKRGLATSKPISEPIDKVIFALRRRLVK